MPDTETVARLIAEYLGDDFDHALANKSEWIATRGFSGGRCRDVNEPYRDDYLAAAEAVIKLLSGATLCP